ncbi:tRNA lysidine(34) synthetase TilS [Marinirhabdus gelatinilytica]|uniref:tRNA(Ile)-lysidine synthase n=1 Tax=Marinirhabdus gelatinilytica TaxID=1703343 RepID=A0A370QF55_9FLAO|nr:tRNA lysidine(34) synthetase TilS [Marinirhabdus gelatinilytica]RDK87004.1 tRNA(Ile)-lysidine synthase [Marinirhabdus gelatinilytica]
MLSEFKKELSQHFSYLKGAKLLIACSGGLDSVVLTQLLFKLKYNIAIAHCNFSLRGKESDEDALFTENLAESLQIPFHSEIFDTETYAKDHKLSTQMAARQLRYSWFDEVIQNFGYDYILTAHHANDDLETFFLNLTRGTGLRGLTGIPSKNEKVVRPLLHFSREEILAYAKSQNLYWREDSSNAKTDYLRNKLRLEVLPKLKETSKDILQHVQKTQKNLQASQALVEDYMTLVYNLAVSENEGGYSIDIAKISELPNTNALLYELLHPFGFTAWDDVYGLLNAQTGKEVVSGSHRLLRNRNEFILTKITENSEKNEFFIKKNQKEINNPIDIKLNPTNKMGHIDNTTVYVDADKLLFPLRLRKWQEGDVFQPFGMQGKKKLSKFFKDEKLSLVAKEQVWLLCSEDKIVWVVNHRLDDRFKITPSTKNLLKITTNP